MDPTGRVGNGILMGIDSFEVSTLAIEVDGPQLARILLEGACA